MMNIHASNCKIVSFYPYSTTVQFRLNEFNEFENRGCPTVKRLFNDILSHAQKILGKNLMDNKIAFKIIHEPTNTMMYVGYKDCIYSIGLQIYQEYTKEIKIADEKSDESK